MVVNAVHEDFCLNLSSRLVFGRKIGQRVAKKGESLKIE
jgi:hypothetical protein